MTQTPSSSVSEITKTTADIAILDADISEGPPSHIEHDFIRESVEPLDMYELSEANLEKYAALMVTGNVDQEFLHRERDIVRAFLDAGKVLVFSGHLSRPWLPGAGTFVPKEIRSFRDYEIRKAKEHPIFEGVEEKDLTFRRGVAGFFARGHNPPPEGAEVLLTLPGDEPIAYVDRKSTRGVILASVCYDLLGFGLEKMNADAPRTSASRIAPQLLAWIRKESR